MRKQVDEIVNKLITKVNPYNSVFELLDVDSFSYEDNLIVVSIGKASWTMAKAASDKLKDRIKQGVVITKYNHSKGEIDNFKIFEAGHPIVDENSIKATEYVLNITANLKESDKVLFLVSGGGSALFEKPLIDLTTLQDINNQLLKSGANINEINMIRKKLSAVKGGKFAKHVYPAYIDTYILSDVIGNDLSSIASGPQAIDKTSKEDIINILDIYQLNINEDIKKLLLVDSVTDIDNVNNTFVSSVEQLCEETKIILESLGYKTKIVESNYTGEAKDLGEVLGRKALEFQTTTESLAFIYGGEAVVKVKGNGLGGRNQELALASAKYLKDCNNTCVFAFGSDGTDGPTDAAGGYVDCDTYSKIRNIDEYLDNNDAYHALSISNGLLMTGPTGSNVNDIYVLMIKRSE